MSWYQEHKKATWLSGAALAAVLIVGGMLYVFHVSGQEDHGGSGNAGKQKQAQPMRVKVFYPKEGGVERIVRRPATVQAFEFADLYAKVSGYLRNQKVDIGSRVKQGDIVAEVYAPEKQADVQKAQADLEKARGNAAAFEAFVMRTKADQTAATARYEASKARLKADTAYHEFRVKQAKRYARLLADRAIEAQLVDEQEDRLQAATEAVNADREAVAAAKAQVDAAVARIKQAEADFKDAKAMIGVAKATLDRAKVWAEYTKIASPYTGVITERNYHNGDFIREAGGGNSKPEPILSVARTDKMRVIIEVPDRAVPYLKVGETADLTIDTLPDLYFQGQVARMAYREAYDTRTMRTEADFPNPDELLEDGMYGYMTIHLGREKGVRIPSRCLIGNEQGDTRSVYVVRDGKAHEVKVEIGIDDGIEVTIRKGLDQTDRVIVSRPAGLGKGMPVEVIHTDTSDTEKAEKASQEKPRTKIPESDNDKSGAKKQKKKS